MNDVARFRKAAYTKDLLSSVGKKFWTFCFSHLRQDKADFACITYRLRGAGILHHELVEPMCF